MAVAGSPTFGSGAASAAFPSGSAATPLTSGAASTAIITSGVTSAALASGSATGAGASALAFGFFATAGVALSACILATSTSTTGVGVAGLVFSAAAAGGGMKSRATSSASPMVRTCMPQAAASVVSTARTTRTGVSRSPARKCKTVPTGMGSRTGMKNDGASPSAPLTSCARPMTTPA